MHRTRTRFLQRALVAPIMILLAGNAHAQNRFITTDTSLDSSNPVNGSAIVGKDNTYTTNSSPTLSMVVGSFVSADLTAYNSVNLRWNL